MPAYECRRLTWINILRCKIKMANGDYYKKRPVLHSSTFFQFPDMEINARIFSIKKPWLAGLFY
jgi:hypothetical protein